jgi:uncharacterized protein YwlG (UPF0340 family)
MRAGGAAALRCHREFSSSVQIAASIRAEAGERVAFSSIGAHELRGVEDPIELFVVTPP